MHIINTNDNFNQYLEIKLDEAVFDHFSYCAMENISEGLLPCRMESEDLLKLKYTIGGKNIFPKDLGRNITLEKIVDAFKQINALHLHLQDYLLDPAYIYFDENTVFIDRATERIYLVLLPIKNIEGDKTYRTWILSLLKQASPLTENRFLLNEIYDYVSSDKFCINGFNDLLSSLDQDQPLLDQDQPLKVAKKEKNSVKPIAKKEPINKKEPIKAQEHKKISFKASQLLSFILSQVLIILITVMIWIFLPTITSDLFKAKVGLILIFISLDAYIIKTFFKSFLNILLEKLKGVKDKNSHLSTDKKFKGVKNKAPLSKLPKNEYETDVLAVQSNQPYIVNIQTKKVYTLDKPSIIIGRQSSLADVLINERTIGRQHCVLKENNGHYDIVDMFSKNGTYINGRKIEVQKPLKLQHGDIIRLANVELQYHVY